MSLAVQVANGAWVAANLVGWRRYERALRDVRGAQEGLLRRRLARQRDTEFGRRHGFDRIASFRAFQERVPLRTYEDYEHDVRRLAGGARRVLTSDRVLRLEPTSGSAGPSKLIPYTATLQAEFRRAIAPWIVDLVRQRPRLLGGRAYWSITPCVTPGDREPSAVPVGFEQDSAYLGGIARRLVERTLAVPSAVATIPDVSAFRRATATLLLRARDLRLVSIWHPSFLSLLLDLIDATWDEQLERLRTGGRLEGSGIVLPPDPRRAAELARLAPGDRAAIWPDLQLISCWGDGHAALHLPRLAREFPGVEIQPKGLIATEAIVSLPYSGRWPLAVASHVLEFLDAERRPHAAWELEEGGEYSPVVSTGGGLYRYRLHDRVQVTGFLHQTPCLRFLGREDDASDLFGEKLGEPFVAQVIRETLAAARVDADFAMLAPEQLAGTTRYVLLLEARRPPPDDLARVLQTGLERNPGYAWCARLGQLAPAAVRRVPPGAYERFALRLAAEGRRLGGVKPAALSARMDWPVALGAAECSAPDTALR